MGHEKLCPAHRDKTMNGAPHLWVGTCAISLLEIRNRQMIYFFLNSATS